MKILQLSKFYPPVSGGIESVVYELTEGLNARGYAADVLCSHTTRGTVTERVPSGYSITRTSSWGKILSTSMSAAMLQELQRRAGKYDVIHVHLPDPLTNLALLWCRPKAKIVVHWHSDIVHQQLALKVYAPLQDWLLRRADAIIATSPPYAASSLWLQPFSAKVHVIPIGIGNPPQPSHDILETIRTRHSGRRIVFSLGRMTYYKGFDVLIDAARLLPEDVVVVVGGGGELLASYRAKAEALGLSRKIIFTGRLSEEEIHAYYRSADIFCLASKVRAEAFGVVLLEAMAAGLPIVATDIPGSGVPWVNQHGITGLNVPTENSEALAQAIQQLLDNRPMHQAMCEAGRARYMQEFTEDRMVSRAVDLFNSL